MGVWNSHTSVGNILGSLIAGYWVSTCWGLSFIVPGAIVAAMGIVCFLFLIERKYPWPERGPPRGLRHALLRERAVASSCAGVWLPWLPPHQVDFLLQVQASPLAVSLLVMLDFLLFPGFWSNRLKFLPPVPLPCSIRHAGFSLCPGVSRLPQACHVTHLQGCGARPAPAHLDCVLSDKVYLGQCCKTMTQLMTIYLTWVKSVPF